MGKLILCCENSENRCSTIFKLEKLEEFLIHLKECINKVYDDVKKDEVDCDNNSNICEKFSNHSTKDKEDFKKALEEMKRNMEIYFQDELQKKQQLFDEKFKKLEESDDSLAKELKLLKETDLEKINKLQDKNDFFEKINAAI